MVVPSPRIKAGCSKRTIVNNRLFSIIARLQRHLRVSQSGISMQTRKGAMNSKWDMRRGRRHRRFPIQLVIERRPNGGI